MTQYILPKGTKCQVSVSKVGLTLGTPTWVNAHTELMWNMPNEKLMILTYGGRPLSEVMKIAESIMIWLEYPDSHAALIAIETKDIVVIE